MTLFTRPHSDDTAPGIAMYGKLLLALLLNLAVAHHAAASCTPSLSVVRVTSTRALNTAAAPAGTVVYEEAWTQTVTLNCIGATGATRRMYTHPVRAGAVINLGPLEFESDVEFSGAENSGTGNGFGVGDYTYYEFPPGVTVSTMTVRLRYKKTGNAALRAGTALPRIETSPSYQGLIAKVWGIVPSFTETSGSIFIFLTGGTKSYGSTCNLTVPPAVTLRGVPQRLFTGIGTVPAERTNFNISADCSGVVTGQVVGVSFSESSRHASGAAGVIAVSEDDGKATGVALQIINTTSGRPIAFNALERGTPPPTLNGTYNFPMRVQYFQTAATVTAGRVNGTTVVTMQYR
jgi:type 1 fimbria pilin